MVKSDGTLYHQHIDQLPGQGLRLRKTLPIHEDLMALAVHYSQPDQADLPCPLIGV